MAFSKVLYDTTSTRPWAFISLKCVKAVETRPHCTQASRSALYTSNPGAPVDSRRRNTCKAPSRSLSRDRARIIATCFATSVAGRGVVPTSVLSSFPSSSGGDARELGVFGRAEDFGELALTSPFLLGGLGFT